MKLWVTQILITLSLFLPGSVISPDPSKGTDSGKSDRCGTFLVINGKSNVNSFSFSFLNSPDDTGSSFRYRSWEKGTEILIPLKEFQASNPRMYNDFLQEVHESEYPYISVFFPYLEPDKLGSVTSGSGQKVLITLAGVTKQYTIECALVNCGDHLALRGSEKIRLTDFRISPPEKLSGLIKVKDEITVSFGIILNFIPDNTYANSR